MQWFILSRDMHVLCAPSTDSPNSLPIFNDKQTILLSNNTVVSTYDFSVQQKHPDAQYLQMGNYVVFVDKYHKTKMYTLMSHDGDDLTHTWHAEDVGLDLLNEAAEKWDYTGQPHDIAWYLNNLVLKDSGWTIGINEASTLTRALKFEGETDTQLRRLGDIANQFDGAEVDFTIEMNGAQVTKQVVNIYKKVGSAVTQGRYIDSVNLTSLHSSGSIADLVTALKPFGAQMDMPEGQEGEAPRITIADVAYDDGRYYSPKGHAYLYDREARQQWSRFRAYNYANQGEFDGYIVGSYTYETKDPNELLNRALTDLKSRNKPSETYEAKLLEINADIGDYVQIAHNNYNPPIYLSARVEQVENCYTAKGQDTGVLGDYRKLESDIDPRIKEMLNALENQIKSHYMWIRYAEDDKGKGMTAAPNIRTTHVAFLSNQKTGVPSDDPADYAGHWVQIKGPKGDKGDNGADGEDGVAGKDGVGVKTTAITYAQSTGGTTPPTTAWAASVPTLIKGQYLWTKTVWTYTDSSTETGYTVSYNAKDGNTGADGRAGKDGVGISNTIIEYVGAVSGTSNPVSGWSTTIPTVPAGQYLWTRTTWQYTDGTSEQGFTNALMGRTGPKGDPGNQGIPGTPGADGRTPYTHWAYAWSADGTDRFTTVYPEENLLLNTSNELKTVTASNWGNSPTSLASGTYGAGKYYASAYIENTTPVGMNLYVGVYAGGKFIHNVSGGALPAGQSGAISFTFDIFEGQLFASAFVGFNSSQTESYTYKYKEMMITRTPSPWTPNPLDDPEDAYPKFIGTYTDYIADDSTDPSKYTWAKMRGEQGPKGDTGKDGVAGKDGVGIESTQIMYAQSTSGTAAPTTGWTAQVPTLIKGQYLWTQTTWLYTDSTGEAGYTVSYNAKDGNSGKDGIAGKDGVGIKSTVIEYAVSSSGVTKPTTGWSTNIPSVVPGQFMWTRTTWLYTDSTNEVGYSVAQAGPKGPKGDTGQGIPGTPGADGRTPYLHTAWANSFDGKDGFSTDVSTNKSYMGTYVNFTEADPTDPALYNWSLIKGRDGSDGAPGKPGADGKTPYFHQAWADSKDGKVDFSTTDPTNRGYLGTYSDFTQADSTDPSKYFWVELVGNLQVGGRNYFLDSKTRTITPPGVANFDWRINISDGFWSNPDRLKSNNIRVSFTLTAKKALTTVFNSSLYFSVSPWPAQPFSYPAGTTTSQKYELVFNITDSAYKTDNCFIRFQAKDTSDFPFVLENAKLEIGTTFTDWSPAPEDTQGQIDKVNDGLVKVDNKIAAVPKVTTSITAPPNPKKGDQWWVIAPDPVTGENGINVFKQWDGSTWAEIPITQSLLVIKELDAVNINGSVINGSKFTNNFDYTDLNKVNFKGVTEIANGSYKTDFKIATTNQVGHVYLQPDGLHTYVSGRNGDVNTRQSIDLAFDAISLANGSTFGTLTAADIESTGREVWITSDGVNKPEVGFHKQFRQVWLDGLIALNTASAAKPQFLFKLKNSKLYPKASRYISLISLRDIPDTAILRIDPDGSISNVSCPVSNMRFIAEGIFYAIGD